MSQNFAHASQLQAFVLPILIRPLVVVAALSDLGCPSLTGLADIVKILPRAIPLTTRLPEDSL